MKKLETHQELEGQSILMIIEFVNKHGARDILYLTVNKKGIYKVYRQWNTLEKITFWGIKKKTRNEALKRIFTKITTQLL